EGSCDKPLLIFCSTRILGEDFVRRNKTGAMTRSTFGAMHKSQKTRVPFAEPVPEHSSVLNEDSSHLAQGPDLLFRCTALQRAGPSCGKMQPRNIPARRSDYSGQRFPGLLIGGQEAFECQFSQRDIIRSPEDRGGGQEGQSLSGHRMAKDK